MVAVPLLEAWRADSGFAGVARGFAHYLLERRIVYQADPCGLADLSITSGREDKEGWRHLTPDNRLRFLYERSAWTATGTALTPVRESTAESAPAVLHTPVGGCRCCFSLRRPPSPCSWRACTLRRPASFRPSCSVPPTKSWSSIWISCVSGPGRALTVRLFWKGAARRGVFPWLRVSETICAGTSGFRCCTVPRHTLRADVVKGEVWTFLDHCPGPPGCLAVEYSRSGSVSRAFEIRLSVGEVLNVFYQTYDLSSLTGFSEKLTRSTWTFTLRHPLRELVEVRRQ